MRQHIAAASLLAGGLVLAAILSGCASDAGAGSATPTAKAAPTPTATPTSAAPDDTLFTITANVRANDGSTIGIQLVAHQPIAYSKTEADPLITEFVKECGAGVAGVPVTKTTLAANGASLMKIDIASSVVGKPFVSPLQLAIGSPYFGQAVVGKGITIIDAKNPCWGGYNWTTSGALAVIADFESGNPGPDLSAWRYAIYGFGVTPDSKATIEACKVTLTDLAKKADVSSIQGWDPTQSGSGTTCAIGYAGE